MSRISGETPPGALTAAERAENVARYAREMKPYHDIALERARSEIVAKYRKSPGSFPDGIDSKWDRWYVAEDWTDAGVYVGDGPCIKAAKPDPGALEKEEAERKAKLAKARAALAGVEGRLGVKPVVVAPAESVTKSADERHEKSSVTKSPMGRPKKEHVLTPAERAKAARDRKKERGE